MRRKVHDHTQSVGAFGCLADFEAERGEQFHQHGAIDRDVVDHEHALAWSAVAGQARFRCSRGRGIGGEHVERNGEGKRAAGPRLACDRERSAHELDEPSADREAETGARFGWPPIDRLLKRLENVFAIRSRDADAGINDRKM